MSDSINDITDHCDSVALKTDLKNFLYAILQELSNTTDVNVFPLRNLSSEQKECF